MLYFLVGVCVCEVVVGKFGRGEAVIRRKTIKENSLLQNRLSLMLEFI